MKLHNTLACLILLTSISVAVSITCFTTVQVQSETITSLIEWNQSLHSQVRAVQRDNLLLEAAISDNLVHTEKLQKQYDLIAAATRMGWGQATKLMRSSYLEGDMQ